MHSHKFLSALSAIAAAQAVAARSLPQGSHILNNSTQSGNAAGVAVQHVAVSVVAEVASQVQAGASQSHASTLDLSEDDYCDEEDSASDGSQNPQNSQAALNARPTASGRGSSSHTYDGPIVTLSPSVHWTVDTRAMKNIAPAPVGNAKPLYYGNHDASQLGAFAFVTYRFESPSVNLDHSAYITVRAESGAWVVNFANREAFDEALHSWTMESGLILIAHFQGCAISAVHVSAGERCFLDVSKLEPSSDSQRLEIRVIGETKDSQAISTGGETNWGWWDPAGREKAGPQPPPRPKDANGPAADISRNSTSDQSSQPKSQGFSARIPCTAEPDGVYGLPTACLGTYFDQDLDDGLGYVTMSEDSRLMLHAVAPRIELDRKPRPKGHPVLMGFGSWLSDAWDNTIKPFAKEKYESVLEAISFSPSLNKQFSFQLPKESSSNEPWIGGTKKEDHGENEEKKSKRDEIASSGANPGGKEEQSSDEKSKSKPSDEKTNGVAKDEDKDNESESDPSKEEADEDANDKDQQRRESPWENSRLIWASGDGKVKANSLGANKSVDVYCVDCGLKCTAKLEGHAKWNLKSGLTEGRLDLNADLNVGMKIGIQAQASYRYNVEAEVATVGIPGLSYGAVTIGPHVSLGVKASFDAKAKGSLLAGAEIGFTNAHVSLDLVNRNNSQQLSWEPSFKPVLQAKGDVAVEASIGLPMSLGCGLVIKGLDPISVAITEEPTLIAEAKLSVASSFKNGSLNASIESIDDCAGIATRLGWRNRLYVNALGSEVKDLINTPDTDLLKKCIKIRRLVRSSGSGYNSTGFGGNMSSVDPYSYEPHLYDTDEQFFRLVTASKNTMVLSCSNGNIYAAKSGPTSVDCSNVWAGTEKEEVVIADGSHKVLHYYADALSKTGVSRLRVHNHRKLPTKAVVVVLALAHKQDQPFYVALDSKKQVLYPLVCDYKDGQASRVFLAKDPREGIGMLQSQAVRYSITGGIVGSFYHLALGNELLAI